MWEAFLHGPGGFRKPVALKLLLSRPTDAATRAEVVREARLGALLHHPNVVGTLQVGEFEGTWCVALELVRGMSVDGLCQRMGGALPPGAVLEIGVQAAEGLAHAHTPDGSRPALVHRDVKPANLLVDRSGVVKLADLGVSQLHGESSRVAGTPGFMAPEQILGRPEPRSDLFSLGAVLYTIATGRRPFGRGKAALAAVTSVEGLLQQPSFLGPVEQAVPGLAAVVRGCLRHEPASRFGSARELGLALAALRSRQAAGPSLLDLLPRSSTGAPVDRSDPPAPSEQPTQLVPVGNLRLSRDAFVGRVAELVEVEALVPVERWIVLVAPGGMGKTRLALEVARRFRASLAGGAWFFDLTEARTVDGICGALGAALGLELERGDPVGQIGRVLGVKGRALVVLDNLEQCVGALAATVGRWLELAPDVTLIGTTRILPALPGERAVRLGELGEADAVALFEARAPRRPTEAERAEIGPLCRALDRIPLAIELAAARLRVLDVAGIRSRLSLALLAGGGVDRPERHRSVTASLRWSAELLSETGRIALAELSVFEGGFDLAAAEAVLDLASCPGAPWALDTLQELADASLLQVEPGTGRFWMLVVVREFAAGMATPDRRAAGEVRHGAHYAQLGTEASLDVLRGPGADERYRMLAADLDNLLVACRRAAARGDGPIATATLVASDAVLGPQGPASTRMALCDLVLGLSALDVRDRVRAARCAVGALVDVGRSSEALSLAESTVALCRSVGDRSGEAVAQGSLGVLFRERRDLDRAREHLEAALVAYRALGMRHGEALANNSLGFVAMEQGRPDETAQRFARALELHRGDGNRRGEGIVLGNQAILDHDQGRAGLARIGLERALALHRETGNRRFEAIVLGNLSVVLQEEGRLDEALACNELALRTHREVGSRRSEGVVHLQLGEVLQALGRADEAERHFEAALERSADDPRATGSVWAARAWAATAHDPATAVAHAERAEEHLRRAHAPALLALLLARKAQALHALGEAERSRDTLDEASGLAPWHVHASAEVERVRAVISPPGA